MARVVLLISSEVESEESCSLIAARNSSGTKKWTSLESKEIGGLERRFKKTDSSSLETWNWSLLTQQAQNWWYPLIFQMLFYRHRPLDSSQPWHFQFPLICWHILYFALFPSLVLRIKAFEYSKTIDILQVVNLASSKMILNFEYRIFVYFKKGIDLIQGIPTFEKKSDVQQSLKVRRADFKVPRFVGITTGCCLKWIVDSETSIEESIRSQKANTFLSKVWKRSKRYFESDISGRYGQSNK